MQSILRRWALFASIPIIALLTLPAGSAYADENDGHTIVVENGHSIQIAVAAAHLGDTIVVKAGVYKENVVITTDNLTLRGAGAGKTFLEPPANDTSGCGICVFGQGDPNGTAPPTRLVRNDRITGLTARNFQFSGIFGWGTDGLVVSRVDAVRNGAYGIARFESTRTVLKDNRASGSGEAGFYVGDSPDAATTVTDNRAWDNDLGIFVRHAHGVSIRENEVFGNCFGALVLDDGQSGGTGDVNIVDNHFNRNNKFCQATGEGPPHGGAGVVLWGAVRSVVQDNEVKNNNISQDLPGRGGVVLLSAAGPPGNGSDATDNTIKDNTIKNNVPVDISWDGKGTNRFVSNDCKTSIPPGLCHQD
jgi:parallel beta-helix repeat protein